MPAFTVTAVDTVNNKLTATGVAAVGGAAGTVLLTGDRLRLRNVGGALPAATPSLAGVTDYFAIRVDDNNIKVAVTNADAMAGTAIDITGSGSGTTTIEFQLPYCVPRIAAALTQLRHEDLNAEWNSLVALYDLLTGQAQSIWTAVKLAVPITTTTVQTLSIPYADFVGAGVAVTYSTGNATAAFSGGGVAVAPVSLPAGAVVVAIRATFQDSAAGPTTAKARLKSTDTAGAIVDIVDSATSAGSGVIQTLPVATANAGSLPLTVLAAHCYWIQIGTVSGVGSVGIYMVEIDYVAPPY